MALKKRIIIAGAAALSVAFMAPGSSLARSAGAPAQITAQESKNAPSADKRERALKKYLEGQRLEQAGNYTGAVAAFKEAIELDPTSAELRIALGTLYLRNRNFIDAEAQAREAMKIAPANLDTRKLSALVHYAQAYNPVNGGQTVDKEKARATIKELEEVVRLDPSAKIGIGDQERPALSLIGAMYLALEDEDKAMEAFKRAADANGASDQAQFELALMYSQQNKWKEAEAAARKAYTINPSQPQYAGTLANALRRLGRTQEALNIYEKAMGGKNTTGQNSELSKEMMILSPLLPDYAEALVLAGRYDEATKLLDPVLKNVRKESPLYLTAVKITTDALRRSGKRAEAVRVLEDSLKGQDVSESLPLVFALAETYEEMFQFDKAVDTYREALAAVVNPDGSVSGELGKRNAAAIYHRIALAYRMAGNRDKTLGTYADMKKTLGADNPIPDQLIIDTLLYEGKSKEAFDVATAAMTRFPDEQGFKLARAQAAARMGDMQSAESTLRPLLKNNAEDADIYQFLAGIQLEANRLKEAEESARKAISLEPNNIGPLITLSSIQDRQKKYKESEATLREALKIDPDNATLLNNLGYFLTERNERLPEAEALVRRAVNIEPTNGSFLDSLGWLLFRQGKVDEAQKYVEQAVIYQPRSSTIHDHLGDIYKKQGNLEKARAKWEDALRLTTEPDEVKSIKDKLKKP